MVSRQVDQTSGQNPVAAYLTGYKGSSGETSRGKDRQNTCLHDVVSPPLPWRSEGLETRHSYGGLQF